MRRAPQRLVWSEGMFLSPQHLQGLDRFHEDLLATRLDAVAQESWGVAALEFDGAALATGQVRLARFAGISPDGLPVAFAEGEAGAPPPRPFAEHFPATARSLDVLLGVSREREGISAYSDGAARFSVYAAQLQDAGRPGASVPVSFARPRPVLLFGGEALLDHETIKIGELVRTGSGQVAFDPEYLPPLLRLAAAPRLLAALRELQARLLAKHRELAELRRLRDGAAELPAAEVVRALQLVVVGGALPVLTHLADPAGAPRPLYRGLAALAGQLAGFSPDADLAALPRFDHQDLRASFGPLLQVINSCLGALGVDRYTRIPLEVRGGFQVARLQDERLLRSQLYLSVRSDVPESQVAEQVPRLCKLAALGDVQALVQAAAPGIPLQIMLRPPEEIPARPGEVCFAIAQDDRLWRNVVTERTLAVWLPPPFDPGRARIELLAVGAAGRGG